MPTLSPLLLLFSYLSFPKAPSRGDLLREQHLTLTNLNCTQSTSIEGPVFHHLALPATATQTKRKVGIKPHALHKTIIQR